MIGRRQELAQVRQRLTGEWRLVTLTGPGGIGKSCLARSAATELERSFADGCVVVDLDEVADAALVGAAVARAAGVHLQGELGEVDHLAQVLREHEVLLVLDGCDRFLEQTAELVAALLARCPGMRVLATGRQPLRLAGEAVLPLGPLACPGSGSVTAATAASYDAVALFVRRARTSVPTFALTDENVDAVVEICTTLGGVPLALELAAARVLVLSPRDIADRLGDRYRLLTKGARGARQAQQSLRASVDASHELCEPAEQTLWARLSVFTGSFDLEAAEAVCSGEGIEVWEVLDLVDSLLERSVLLRDVDDGSTVRYRMLESLRTYGDERLEPDERRTWQRRHLDWCSGLASRACSEWFGDQQVTWCRRLQRETPNLLAALERATRDPVDALVALRMVCDLEPFWVVTGRVGEGRRWIDRAVTAAGGCRQPAVREERDARLEHAQASVAAAPEPNAAPGSAEVVSAGGDAGPAELDPLLEARVLAVGAELATIAGEHEQVRARVESAERLLGRHALDDARLSGALRRAQGIVLLREGDVDAGRRCLESAVATSARSGDRYGQAQGVLALGMCLLGRDRDAGRSALQEAVELGQEAGEVHVRSYALGFLALDAAQVGDWESAEPAARDTLTMRAALGDEFGVSFGLELMACVAAAHDDAERAAQLFGAAESRRRSVGVAQQTAEGLADLREAGRGSARQVLGARRFEAALRRGHELDREESLRLALDGEQVGAVADPVAQLVEADDVALTPREAEVAQLVGQGMSNREIAEALVISHRTAQGHVEHILRKLGFSSRTQVAAWVAERQARSMLR